MPMHLITIPISHYCEKARWALERCGLPFIEQGHLQVLHYWAVRRAGGGATVPVLVTAEGAIADSTQIVRWADGHLERGQRLFPSDDHDVSHWEERFDQELGPASRLWAYQVFLAHPRLGLRFGRYGLPGWQRFIFPGFLPIMGAMVKARYRITQRSADRAKSVCRQLLDEVAAQLSDDRPYLLGERFTAADLTFAALGAPLILPAEYGIPIVQPDDLPTELQAEFREFRSHPAGAYALRLYREERLRTV